MRQNVCLCKAPSPSPDMKRYSKVSCYFRACVPLSLIRELHSKMQMQFSVSPGAQSLPFDWRAAEETSSSWLVVPLVATDTSTGKWTSRGVNNYSSPQISLAGQRFNPSTLAWWAHSIDNEWDSAMCSVSVGCEGHKVLSAKRWAARWLCAALAAAPLWHILKMVPEQGVKRGLPRTGAHRARARNTRCTVERKKCCCNF